MQGKEKVPNWHVMLQYVHHEQLESNKQYSIYGMQIGSGDFENPWISTMNTHENAKSNITKYATCL